MLSSCSCDRLAIMPSIIPSIAGLLRSIWAICRIWAAWSVPPSPGIGIAGVAPALWVVDVSSVTSVMIGRDEAVLPVTCIRSAGKAVTGRCSRVFGCPHLQSVWIAAMP